MDTALVLQNLLSPAILFFFLGVFAVLLGSDLEIPAPLPKLFSLYLLLSIGFKGGVELQASGLGPDVLLTIGAALLMAVLVPLAAFALLRTQFLLLEVCLFALELVLQLLEHLHNTSRLEFIPGTL